jgi:dTDP-4-dehydrorhamnose 3,5-epimerase-like enzyme
MQLSELTTLQLENRGDGRGSSFSLPHRWLRVLTALEDMHISTLLPGHIRGNHYHVDRRELIVVLYADSWSLHWDGGPGTPVQRHEFEGSGAALIVIPPLASHAIRNDGRTDLQLMAASDGRYDPAAPDAYPRKVTSP